jgi:hypothetical protein
LINILDILEEYPEIKRQEIIDSYKPLDLLFRYICEVGPEKVIKCIDEDGKSLRCIKLRNNGALKIGLFSTRVQVNKIRTVKYFISEYPEIETDEFINNRVSKLQRARDLYSTTNKKKKRSS